VRTLFPFCIEITPLSNAYTLSIISDIFKYVVKNITLAFDYSNFLLVLYLYDYLFTDKRLDKLIEEVLLLLIVIRCYFN